MLAPPSARKLENQSLSAVRDYLFSIFAATFHIWRPFPPPQPEDALCKGGSEFREYLLSFGADVFVFYCAFQKYKD